MKKLKIKTAKVRDLFKEAMAAMIRLQSSA